MQCTPLVYTALSWLMLLLLLLIACLETYAALSFLVFGESISLFDMNFAQTFFAAKNVQLWFFPVALIIP